MSADKSSRRISRPYTVRWDAAADAPAPPRLGEYTADLVFIVSRDGRVLFVSQALGDVAPDAAMGTNFSDWIPEAQRAAALECIEQVFATGLPQGYELAGLPRHAPSAWYECRVAPNLRGGEVVSATIIARDVTRHRRAIQESERRYEEVLRLLEERSLDLAHANEALSEISAERDTFGTMLQRFRALLDAAGEAIFITDAGSGQLVDINETACRWLRARREDLVGRTPEEMRLGFTILVPEDQELQFTETRDTRRPIVVGGGAQRRQDGSSFPVEVAVARHRYGEGEYILAVVRDVKDREHGTELLKQREAAYHDLFEQSWDAIYLTTRSGSITAANRAASELFGYSAEEFAGLDARVLFPRAEHIRLFQQKMAAEGHVRGLEVELAAKDGRAIPALLSATRRYANGTIQGHQCIVRPLAPQYVAPAAEAPQADAPDALVLVLDPDDDAREEARRALERAQVAVLTAADQPAALDLLRHYAGQVAAVVVGAEPGQPDLDHAIEELRRIDPTAPVVVSSVEDRLALVERLAGLGVAAFVDRPIYPLALVQKIREAAAARSPSDAPQ